MVYASPEYISTLKLSTPNRRTRRVDFGLRGCPINKYQLVELISATLAGRRPNIPAYSVCVECNRAKSVCVGRAWIPCLGPVTHAGCNAICPKFHSRVLRLLRYDGEPNTAALSDKFRVLGQTNPQIRRAFRGFNAWAWQFRKASEEA